MAVFFFSITTPVRTITRFVFAQGRISQPLANWLSPAGVDAGNNFFGFATKDTATCLKRQALFLLWIFLFAFLCKGNPVLTQRSRVGLVKQIWGK